MRKTLGYIASALIVAYLGIVGGCANSNQVRKMSFAGGLAEGCYSAKARESLNKSLSLILRVDGINEKGELSEEDKKKIEGRQIWLIKNGDKNKDGRVDEKEAKTLYEMINQHFLKYSSEKCTSPFLRSMENNSNKNGNF